jgi:hypothetical protein
LRGVEPVGRFFPVTQLVEPIAATYCSIKLRELQELFIFCIVERKVVSLFDARPSLYRPIWISGPEEL